MIPCQRRRSSPTVRLRNPTVASPKSVVAGRRTRRRSGLMILAPISPTRRASRELDSTRPSTAIATASAASPIRAAVMRAGLTLPSSTRRPRAITGIPSLTKLFHTPETMVLSANRSPLKPQE